MLRRQKLVSVEFQPEVVLPFIHVEHFVDSPFLVNWYNRVGIFKHIRNFPSYGKMVFLGSSKTDKAGRITLIKEVKEILQLSEKDHVMFYLEDGEVVIRKYVDVPPDVMGSGEGFYEWVRKKKIEIELIEDSDVKELEQERLNERLDQAREYENAMKELNQ